MKGTRERGQEALAVSGQREMMEACTTIQGNDGAYKNTWLLTYFIGKANFVFQR